MTQHTKRTFDKDRSRDLQMTKKVYNNRNLTMIDNDKAKIPSSNPPKYFRQSIHRLTSFSR